jgi:dTDP-L-rhamnose 4-epimerase
VATSEDDDPRPTSVYGITKLVQEQLSLTLGRSYGVPTVALRFFNVYGSRQALSNPYTGILATFVTRLRAGKPLLIYEDGEQLRDFVHVQDVVRACEGAMAYRGEGHEVFNVGSGTATTISSLARTMGTLVRGDGDRGSPGLEVTGHYRVGDIRDCFADTARARSELGYAPSIRLEEGLREFLEWAEEQPLQDHTDEAARELNAAGMLRKARDAVVDARLSWG